MSPHTIAARDRDPKRRPGEQLVRNALPVIAAYRKVARPIMLRDWRPDSCIGATRVAINVLSLWGIEVLPRAVIATMHNQAWHDLTERLGRFPNDPSDWEGTDAWAIGLGVPPRPGDVDEPNKYSGHLVAVLPEYRLLLDGSLDQASRPEKDLTVHPEIIAFGIDAAFVRGERDHVLWAANESGVWLSYQPNPDAPSWEDAPSWQLNHHGLTEIAIVRAMAKEGIEL